MLKFISDVAEPCATRTAQEQKASARSQKARNIASHAGQQEPTTKLLLVSQVTAYHIRPVCGYTTFYVVTCYKREGPIQRYVTIFSVRQKDPLQAISQINAQQQACHKFRIKLAQQTESPPTKVILPHVARDPRYLAKGRANRKKQTTRHEWEKSKYVYLSTAPQHIKTYQYSVNGLRNYGL